MPLTEVCNAHTSLFKSSKASSHVLVILTFAVTIHAVISVVNVVIINHDCYHSGGEV